MDGHDTDREDAEVAEIVRQFDQEKLDFARKFAEEMKALKQQLFYATSERDVLKERLAAQVCMRVCACML